MTEKHLQKEPLVRLAKRDGMAGAGQWGIRIAAILLALVVGGLVILLSGNNPIQGYAIIVEGALGKTCLLYTSPSPRDA